MFADRRMVDLGDEWEAQAYQVLTDSVAAILDSGVEQATLASWAIVHGLAMLALDGRLRLYQRTDWTCAHATRPPKSGDRVLVAGVPTPHPPAFTEGRAFLAGLEQLRNRRLIPPVHIR